MSISSAERPTRRVLLQRVRNRLIDYLEVASSFDEQLLYQERTPEVNVATEVVFQWEDWVSADWQSELVEPVFSDAERHGIAQFQTLWTAVNAAIPDPCPSLNVMLERPEWMQLRMAAAALLAIFVHRGRLSEEREED